MTARHFSGAAVLLRRAAEGITHKSAYPIAALLAKYNDCHDSDDGEFCGGGSSGGSSSDSTERAQQDEAKQQHMAANKTAYEDYKSNPATEMSSPLTEAEDTALNDYQMSDWEAINGIQRGTVKEGSAEYRDNIDKANSISAAIERSSLKSDAVLYRGIAGNTGKKLGTDLANAKGLIGKELPASGFQSVSMDQKVAEGFAEKSQPVMVIKAPKGTNAYDMRGNVDGGMASQKEILLKPGKYVVDGVEAKGGRTYVHVTYRAG